MNREKIRNHFKNFILIYLSSFLTISLIIFFLIYTKTQVDFKESINFWIETMGRIITYFPFWIILIIPYLLSFIIKSIFKRYQKMKLKGLIIGVLLYIAIPVILFFLANKVLQFYRLTESNNYEWDYTVENTTSKINDFYTTDKKQRGIHVFHLGDSLKDIATLKKNNFEWITLTPFIGQKEYNKPTIRTLSPDRFERTKERYKHIKVECDKFGIKIMLKPHVWLNNSGNGKWRSDIEMSSEEDWQTWFNSYADIIITYAKIAQELNLEQFCIGTELETTVNKKPEKWLQLIHQVKANYKGKITYAANWNHEYIDVPFWDQLDFIGIQAYFPLSKKLNSTLVELQNAWQPFIKEMASVSKKHNKPIVFTEIGYRSLQGTARAPWEWSSFKHYFYKISKKEQFLCYQAFFNTVWQQPWFRGIHIWEWQGSYSDGNNTDFTLENKPALNLITREFQKKN